MRTTFRCAERKLRRLRSVTPGVYVQYVLCYRTIEEPPKNFARAACGQRGEAGGSRTGGDPGTVGLHSAGDPC